MHVVFRESHGLEENDTPTDLGQSPADLVVLSFSDSDLGAFATAWHRADGSEGKMPSLRLANLVALRHPLSVDTYVEQTLGGAKGILIRLIGGVSYWAYGLQQVRALAQERGIALAVLPADGRADAQLDDYSTLPHSTLKRLAHLCDTGGAIAAQAALAQIALAAGLYAGPVPGSKALPRMGAWTPASGVYAPQPQPKTRPRVLITFYRSYLVAADIAPIEALMAAFGEQGLDVLALYVPSLKDPEAALWLRGQISQFSPDTIVNATAFSGRDDDASSPLDEGGVPVFQVVLATSTHQAWQEAERGLSPADLAMHVVLPEVDGRIMGGVVSFKEPGVHDAHLQFARYIHAANKDMIDAVVARVMGWMRLQQTPVSSRRPALVLSTYPGKNWNAGHAVGLDAPASACAMLSDLAQAGYDVADVPDDLPGALQTHVQRWPLADYQKALHTFPEALQTALHDVWGPPEADAAFENSAFCFAALPCGRAWVALQPERGDSAARDAQYHDLARVPRHAYVAFYLWLRSQADALVHIGAHGTLEWLPGKSVALSRTCWPEALIGDLPVIYPFIVNDPGEAAQAKRRIGALTVGHIPPPMSMSKTPDRLIRLEALLDEFSNADGLDPRRRDRLQNDIRDEARALGLEDDLGLETSSCAGEALTRIDRFVCDVKESQFGNGLHIWGRPAPADTPFDTDASVACERAALITALDGRRIEAGPSGSPYRGRRDVLPTGRNIYTTDPRAVPTRAAYEQGARLSAELIRRHLQDHGDWPHALVVDLWGSATMRTAGEDFAMALSLMGVRPIWDAHSGRVSGIEVLPISELDHPRIDVTLRVSGLFRDVFPALSALFSTAVRALEARDEAPEWNPFAGRAAQARVYGPRPGTFGIGMSRALDDYTDEGRRLAGQAWLDASSWVLEGGQAHKDAAGLHARVAQADGFVHVQDLPETDLLLAQDYAAHEGGFAAAQAVTGGNAALWHMDNTRPNTPRARTLSEEVARTVQARAANPDWIAGMQRHGFRGAAEIAATLEHMAAFAQLSGTVGAHLFDLYYDATLGDDETHNFLAQNNPEALRAMQDRFYQLADAGLWQTRRNSIRAAMEPPA